MLTSTLAYQLFSNWLFFVTTIIALHNERQLNCKKCGKKHFPPTGARCSQESNTTGGDTNAVTSLLDGLKNSLEAINKRLEVLEGNRLSDSSVFQSDVSSEATTEVLRQDSALAEKVQQRLAMLNFPGSKNKADDPPKTTSGATKTADDLQVKKDIPWPHFYVHRGPERRPVQYKQLSMSEFVFGYICMISDSKQDEIVRQEML